MNKNKVFELKQRVMQLTNQKDYTAAKKYSLKLVKLCPKDIEVRFSLAELQALLGEVESAVRSYCVVCQSKASSRSIAAEKAMVLCYEYGLNQLGLVPAEVLVKLNPDSVSANFFLGLFLFKLQQFVSSRPFLLKAVELEPSVEAYTNYCALSYIYTGQVSEGLEVLNSYLCEFGDQKGALILRTSSSNYLDNLPELKVFEFHKKCGSYFESQCDVVDDISINPKSKKLKVGYISPNLCLHSVAFFFDAILCRYTRSRYEVYCYSDVSNPDHVTNSFKQKCDHWVDSVHLSDESLFDKIRDDGIDILVDLAGYTGKGRMQVFTKRAAPVQVSYLGYPNTTGLSRIDYRITDSWSDPEEMTDDYYTERLIRLPGGFLCYSLIDAIPDVAPFSLECNKGVRFGSFNSLLKISPELMKVWAKILKSVPKSTLFIKAKPFVEKILREQVWSLFESQGISKDRVSLVGWTAEQSSHLKMYDNVDIHLDSYPYNGTTTTIEALLQGVPVVTLVGLNHRSRVGFSILKQIGLESLVAKSEDGYIKVAVELAFDRIRLEALRASLRERLTNSSLMNQVRFVNELEDAYELMIHSLE
ncbi:MAG: protein O-GlcNAc transferase [Oleiphilaceae bacterium]|jgi:protein O-GlcNAc transferase